MTTLGIYIIDSKSSDVIKEIDIKQVTFCAQDSKDERLVRPEPPALWHSPQAVTPTPVTKHLANYYTGQHQASRKSLHRQTPGILHLAHYNNDTHPASSHYKQRHTPCILHTKTTTDTLHLAHHTSGTSQIVTPPSPHSGRSGCCP